MARVGGDEARRRDSHSCTRRPLGQRLELGLVSAGATVTSVLWLAAVPKSRWARWLFAAGGAAALAAYAFPATAKLDPVAVPRDAVAVVTGGSKGIGLAAALMLRESLGFARVLVASRSAPPADALARGLEHVRADLSTLAGADALATELRKRVARIDLLVLNAGLGLRWATVETTDGLSMLHAVNHVAQVRLLASEHIQALLRQSPTSPSSSLNRVVFVTSGAQAQVDESQALAPLTAPVSPHETYEAYALSKFHQVVFARKLARDGRHFAVSVMPGAVNSQIFGEFAASERAQMTRAYFPNVRHQAVLRALELVVVPLAAALRVARHFTWDSVERGAERVLWCALDRRIPSGTYCNNFGDIDVLINPLALNVTLAKVVAQQALRAARVLK